MDSTSPDQRICTRHVVSDERLIDNTQVACTGDRMRINNIITGVMPCMKKKNAEDFEVNITKKPNSSYEIVMKNINTVHLSMMEYIHRQSPTMIDRIYSCNHEDELMLVVWLWSEDKEDQKIPYEHSSEGAKSSKALYGNKGVLGSLHPDDRTAVQTVMGLLYCADAHRPQLAVDVKKQTDMIIVKVDGLVEVDHVWIARLGEELGSRLVTCEIEKWEEPNAMLRKAGLLSHFVSLVVKLRPWNMKPVHLFLKSDNVIDNLVNEVDSDDAGGALRAIISRKSRYVPYKTKC